jgi:hypothetical protein
LQTVALLVLVHACHGEIDFPDPKDVGECVLMWHVQAAKVGYTGAKDSSRLPALIKQVRRYNSIFKIRSDRQRWVLEIDLDCGRPANLTGLRWDWRMEHRPYSRAASCRAVVEAARAFLDKPGQHPRPRATHYGGDCRTKRGACDPPPACATRIRTRRSYRQVYYNYWKCPPRRKTIPAHVARSRRR